MENEQKNIMLEMDEAAMLIGREVIAKHILGKYLQDKDRQIETLQKALKQSTEANNEKQPNLD